LIDCDTKSIYIDEPFRLGYVAQCIDPGVRKRGGYWIDHAVRDMP
jgi:hypothetical protein